MTLLSAIVILTNLAFTAAFDTDTRCPAWVAYDLEPSEVVRKSRATMNFTADPRVDDTNLGDDYAHTGYDRGHLAPAADFNFDRAALAETYRYTNVVPQSPVVNRGRWLDIEREVRRLAESSTVHVVTAPLYRDLETHRVGRVRVPAYLVKVAYGAFGFRVWCVPNDLASDRKTADLLQEKSK